MEFIPWRDEHVDTKFPFTLESSMLTDTGYVLPPNFLADMILHVPTNHPEGNLLQIVVTDTSVELTFGSALGVIGTATLLLTTLAQDEFVEVFNDEMVVGTLVLGSQKEAPSAWPIGTHTFSGTAKLCLKACMPIPSTVVTGFRLPDGQIMSGDVWLVGGRGVTLRLDPNQNLLYATPNGSHTKIEVNAIGDPLFRQQLCVPDELYVVPRILKILRITNGEDTIDLDTSNGEPIQLLTASPDAENYLNGIRIVTTADSINFDVVGYE